MAFSQSNAKMEVSTTFISAGASADYEIGPGDVLGISIYRSPAMTSAFTVSADGSVAFPEIGAIAVSGRTTAGVSDILEQSLKRQKILVDPHVTVTVTQLRAHRISIMGAVQHPGEISVDRKTMTLSTALAIAGANFGTGSSLVTIIAAGEDASRGTRRQVLLNDIVAGLEDRPVRDGDVFVVQAPPTAYVSGEVGHPGAYAIEPGMAIGQALALAGGVTQRGSTGRIRIIRKLPDGTTQSLSGSKLTDPVRPDDLILVRTRIF